MITVVASGAATFVEDGGRRGFAGIGVSPSGFFDRGAAAAANRLVGNDPPTAALEALGGGLCLRSAAAMVVAVTGAQGPVRVAGEPVARNSTVIVPPDADLELGHPTRGARSYVAVRGGIAARPVLSSRSWDTLGRLGPRPLTVGDLLSTGPAIRPLPPVDHIPTWESSGPLAVTPGPRLDWFTRDSWDRLTTTEYTVASDSDRVGIRLTGDPLTRSRGGELPPEGLVRGAIQVPPDGQPILLGPDHPATGGYPVIGVLTAAAADRCAQLLPGDRIRLSAILVAGR